MAHVIMCGTEEASALTCTRRTLCGAARTVVVRGGRPCLCWRGWRWTGGGHGVPCILSRRTAMPQQLCRALPPLPLARTATPAALACHCHARPMSPAHLSPLWWAVAASPWAVEARPAPERPLKKHWLTRDACPRSAACCRAHPAQLPAGSQREGGCRCCSCSCISLRALAPLLLAPSHPPPPHSAHQGVLWRLSPSSAPPDRRSRVLACWPAPEQHAPRPRQVAPALGAWATWVVPWGSLRNDTSGIRRTRCERRCVSGCAGTDLPAAWASHD